MQAVLKALAIVCGEDAHGLSTRTFDPSLIQKSSTKHSKCRTQALKQLFAEADKLNSPRLATLAFEVHQDAFTRVKKASKKAIGEGGWVCEGRMILTIAHDVQNFCFKSCKLE